FIVFADIIVGYILNPYHPLRRTLNSIVQPLLAPIRRFMPPMGMLDLSPMVLIILIQLVETILIRLLM
ncbi:MAG: YggT family protein, partial [Anaerolineales bacterium]|nr:YggT family protein [Anaerolineales bacterium]